MIRWLFKRPAPVQLRDIDGKFLPQRLAVRKRAIQMAVEMGRADLVSRLFDQPTSLPPAPPETSDRDFGSTRSPAGTSAEAGQGTAYVGANDRDVATFNFGERA